MYIYTYMPSIFRSLALLLSRSVKSLSLSLPRSLVPWLPRSFVLSLSRSHAVSLSRSLALFLSCSLSLFFARSLSHTRSFSRSCSRYHFLSLSFSLSLSLALARSLSLSLPSSLSNTYTHTRTRTGKKNSINGIMRCVTHLNKFIYGLFMAIYKWQASPLSSFTSILTLPPYRTKEPCFYRMRHVSEKEAVFVMNESSL